MERHRLLLESPHLQEETSPRRSSRLSSESYALSLAALPASYAASASSPANTIDIFDKATLVGVQTLVGHENSTTSLMTANNIAGVLKPSLISSGTDGSVKVWDDRSNSHSIKMTNLGNSQGLLCCDVSPDGLTVAAGTELKGEDAMILYWDPRQPAAPLRTHTSTHSDDITVVRFAPSKDPSGFDIVLSGSADGLLCTSNASESDEDESTIQIGNWGCSISQAGWIQGDPSPSVGVWAASDMETFSTWTSELDQLMSLDIRSPVLHQRRTWVTDYLITTHSTRSSIPNLSVFTGSNEGDAALISNLNISVPDAPWCLHKLFTRGHIGIVRSLLWDEENNIVITGGEDSKINSWPFQPVELPDNDDEIREDEQVEDVEMASPRPKKRELGADTERKGKKAKRQ